jgi:glycosyltransferase involved in cell wall biosynthesis
MSLDLIYSSVVYDEVDISICVPLKDRSYVESEIGVLELFPNCLRRLRDSISDSDLKYEIIIADFDSTDCVLMEWVPEILKGINCKIIGSSSSFSRGLGMNICVANSSGKYLFFTDSDILVDSSFLLDLEGKYNDGKIYFPVCFRADKDNRDFNFEKGDWEGFGYGLCSLPRSVFYKVNGWPEFNSYGGEDNIFFKNCGDLFSKNIVRCRANGLLHQWHPPSRNLNYSNKTTTDYFEYVKSDSKKKYYPKNLSKYKIGV